MNFLRCESVSFVGPRNVKLIFLFRLFFALSHDCDDMSKQRQGQITPSTLSFRCDMTQRACVLCSQFSNLRRNFNCLDSVCPSLTRTVCVRLPTHLITRSIGSFEYLPNAAKRKIYKLHRRWSISTDEHVLCNYVSFSGLPTHRCRSQWTTSIMHLQLIRKNQTSSSALHVVPCASTGAKYDYFYHLSSSSDPNEATKSISHIFP